MTDIERIIEQEQRRLDELSRPEIWERYTKNMESGELRDFTQSFRDSQTIVAALRRTDQYDKAEGEGLLVVLPCKVERIKDAIEKLHASNGCLYDDIGLSNDHGDCSKGCFQCVMDGLRKEAKAALGGGGDGRVN